MHVQGRFQRRCVPPRSPLPKAAQRGFSVSSRARIERTSPCLWGQATCRKRELLSAKLLRGLGNLGSQCCRFFLIISVSRSWSPSVSVRVRHCGQCDYLNACMRLSVDNMLQNHIQGRFPACYFHSFFVFLI